MGTTEEATFEFVSQRAEADTKAQANQCKYFLSHQRISSAPSTREANVLNKFLTISEPSVLNLYLKVGCPYLTVLHLQFSLHIYSTPLNMLLNVQNIYNEQVV